jgi:hypothetical protein
MTCLRQRSPMTPERNAIRRRGGAFISARGHLVRNQSSVAPGARRRRFPTSLSAALRAACHYGQVTGSSIRNVVAETGPSFGATNVT